MKKPTKTKAVKAVKIKARKMWAYGDVATKTFKVAKYFAGVHGVKCSPAAMLPIDAASVEAMVEQIKKAWIDSPESDHIDDMARTTLAAIGIKGGAK